MKKDYTVTVPLYGYIEVDVEAESKQQAIDDAIEDCKNIFVDCSEMKGGDHTVVLPYKTICKGNVSFIEKSEVEVVGHEE